MSERTESSRPLHAAMVRFPTLEPRHWSTVVKALASLGFTAIDIPFVWREHETGHGRFEFAHGRLALRDAARVALDHGLDVIARTGPLSTDDAPGLGLPESLFHDRAMHARTARGNPVLVPDPPRLVPLPSTRSASYVARVREWLTAVAEELNELKARDIALRKVIVGDGPHALVRDDPQDVDPATLPNDNESAWRTELLAMAHTAGLNSFPLSLAIPGGSSLSLAARDHRNTLPLAWASPPAIAGSLAIWRHIRHACTLGGERRAHFDFWSGGPWYYPPSRGSHAALAARVAIAAGAVDFTVRMGAAADRWIGSLVSETGELRPHAHQWKQLLSLARTLASPPAQSREISFPIVATDESVKQARSSSVLSPLPMGLLSLMGLRSDEAETLREHTQQRELEDACITRCVPFHVSASESSRSMEDVERDLAAVRPKVEPTSSTLIRVLEGADTVRVIVLSQSHHPSTVTPTEGAWQALHHNDPSRESYVLQPGEVLVLERRSAS